MTESSLFAVVLGAALASAGMYALGRLFLGVLGITLTRLELTLFSFLTGAAALSSIAFALCAIHQARKGVFIAIVVLAVIAAFKMPTPALDVAKSINISRDQLSIAGLIYVYFSVIYLVNAIAPEFSPDGATYHLGNVARWWRLFGFDDFTGSIYSDLSQGFELLFLVAFTLGKHPAAAVLHCLFGMLLPFLLFSYGVRIGKAWIMASGGLMLFVSPVVGKTTSSAYNDLAVACILFGVYYLLELWKAKQNPRLLLCCGWLAGFAFSVKYTAIVGFVYSLLFVAWEARKLGRAQRSKYSLLLSGSAAVTALPWLVRNSIVLDNPFSPFFNRIFDNPYVHVSFEQSYAKTMSLSPEVGSRLNLPWNWAVEGIAVGGIFGPWILFVPLAILFIRNPLVLRLLLAALVMGCPIFLNSGSRFLLPALVFAAPALMIAFARLGIRPLAVLAIHAALSIPQIVPLYAGPHVWRFEDFPWRAALRLEPERAFLDARLGGLHVADAMERIIPVNAKSYATFQIPLAYTTRRVWHKWLSAESEIAQFVLLYALNPSSEDGFDIHFSFPSKSASSIRISSGEAAPGPWLISEISISQNGTLIPLRKQWQVTARPNRWEARLAADLNTATRWSTWLPLSKGDFIELGFDHPLELDRISLVAGGIPHRGNWLIETQTASGAKERVNPAITQSSRTKNSESRLTSTHALKSLGFDYLIVNRDEELGRDILDRTAEWGLKTVWRVDDAAIFQIP